MCVKYINPVFQDGVCFMVEMAKVHSSAKPHPPAPSPLERLARRQEG